jgi:superfamily I DNA/RNA helicase
MIEIKEAQDSYLEYPGPILLLAGPGTGKTRQLAIRVKYLIQERNATPDEIAVITFTNEAARNMRDKLSEKDIAIPADSIPSIISTMHSLGNSIVGSAPQSFGLDEEYEVLHQDEPREVLLQDAATIAGFDRASWEQTDDCRRKGYCAPDDHSDACRICREYKALLRKCARVDYDDQILLACEALKSDGALLASWQARARYLLVDEYQDINEAQCELIQLLSAAHPEGLFAVGDDDQSIYSFRGGSPKYIKEFEQYFGEKSKIGRLSKSWRCPSHVLRGARKVVRAYYPESVAKPEPTFSDKIEEDNRIVFYDVPSDQWEARIIASLAKSKIKTSSVIVIIPNRKYLPPIKAALKRHRLDYTYRSDIDPNGIVRFAVLADWIENPHDNVALRYLLDLIVHNHDSLTRNIDGKSGTLSTKRIAASELLAGLWKEVGGEKSLYAVLSDRAGGADSTGFLKGVRSCIDEAKALLLDKGSKRDGLPPFLQQCGLLVAPGKSPCGIINEVREWRCEKDSARTSSSYRPIRIYNMPSSKGLEGDVVIVIGLSKDLFPKPDADIAESSRLFYVTMTRARKELHLFSARRRPGSITFHEASYQLQKSPFVDAIPEEHMERKIIYPKKKGKGT